MDKLRERVELILDQGESTDEFPPFRCLPIGHSDWRRLKAIRIIALCEEEIRQDEINRLRGSLKQVCESNPIPTNGLISYRPWN